MDFKPEEKHRPPQLKSIYNIFGRIKKKKMELQIKRRHWVL